MSLVRPLVCRRCRGRLRRWHRWLAPSDSSAHKPAWTGCLFCPEKPNGAVKVKIAQHENFETDRCDVQGEKKTGSEPTDPGEESVSSLWTYYDVSRQVDAIRHGADLFEGVQHGPVRAAHGPPVLVLWVAELVEAGRARSLWRKHFQHVNRNTRFTRRTAARSRRPLTVRWREERLSCWVGFWPIPIFFFFFCLKSQ